MLNDLIQRRVLIVTEISEKEAELASLDTELASMEDKHYQAQMIESALEEYYAELYQNHPIDRSQEDEIRDLIQDKRDSIEKAGIKREEDIKSVGRYWYLDEKKRELKIKAANKSYVNELKRIFGELEVDIKRFYQKNISKTDLVTIIGLMEMICVKGAEVGTIPLSYQQKIYKWQQAVKELPDDEQRDNIEEEEQEKQRILARLDVQKRELEKINKESTSLKKTCALQQKELEEQRVKLSTLNTQLSMKTKNIEDDTTEKKEKAQIEFDSNFQKIKESRAKRKEELRVQIAILHDSIMADEERMHMLKNQKKELMETCSTIQREYQNKVSSLRQSINANRQELGRLEDEQLRLSNAYTQAKNDFDDKLSSAQKNILNSHKILEQLRREKKDWEEAAQRAFILSFRKKTKHKGKNQKNALRITEMEKTIQEEESARIALQRDDPELNETHPLKDQLEKVSSSIARLAQTIQDQESQISSLTAENPACNSIHPVKVQLADVTEKIEQLVKAIDDQHAQNASLAAEYPELEDEQVINALKQQYLKAIEEIDSQANEKLSNLHLGQEEVASRIQSLTAAIDEGRKRLNTLQDELEKRKAKLQDIEQQINDFHTNYLIGKFGSKFQIKQQKSQKKAEAKTISAEIRKLSKELAALDKMIAKAEKEQKKQMEAQRASQIEKAKEDEKARREQEERQQRIKKNLRREILNSRQFKIILQYLIT